MPVVIRQYHPNDQAALEALVLVLYDDDPGVMHRRKIRRTLKELDAHPEKGSIVVFTLKRQVVGYALLIYFWSNEYGGNVVMIDELCLAEGYRGQGIATQFFHYLLRTRPKRCVMLQLEVVHTNHGARRLYERIGFKSHKNHVMTLELKNSLGKKLR